jgi:hypothetical protein
MCQISEHQRQNKTLKAMRNVQNYYTKELGLD